MQWNPDASDLANQYIDNVRQACLNRGIDPEAVAKQVYNRILAQVLASGVEVVSADLVRGILAASGSAEAQVPGSVPPPLPAGGVYLNPMAHGQAPSPREPQKWKGSSSASAGCIIAGAVGFGLFMLVGILAAILLPALARAREAARQAACQNNLKQVSVLLQMYANEHGGRYPGWVNEPGYLIFDAEVLAGSDMAILQCPSEETDYSGEHEDGSVNLDSDYLYLGFAVRSQEEMETLVEAASRHDNDLEALTAQFSGPDVAAGVTPLRSILPDPASVPVLVEWHANHQYRGANVVYLDGHTEFIQYGAKFPVTEAFYEAAQDLLD